MRPRNYGSIFLLIVCILVVSLVAPTSCAGPAPTPTTEPPPQGKTIVVSSTADSGPDTLRQTLLDAQSGDTITFDPAVFPPSAPATIYLTSSLPLISQGNLKIEASNAGVILDGSNISEEWAHGLDINSDGNIIRGLQIVNFSPGTGIALGGGAQYNIIGGDRSVGSGPLGQGNLVSNVNTGIALLDDGTSFNTITGNLIGTNPTGMDAWSNYGYGVHILEGASRNIIGPDNIVAHNNINGIGIQDLNSFGNTITQNSIHDNKEGGIYLWEGGNTALPAPVILDFDLAAGTVTGFASADCTVEIFSDSSDEGEVYEGQTTADRSGFFTFNKGASFTFISGWIEVVWSNTPILSFNSSSCLVGSRPRALIKPLSGVLKPSIISINVILPAPFGPTSPNISPSSTLKLTSFTAIKSP